MRTQVLLAQKMMVNEDMLRSAVSNFPKNVVDLHSNLKQKITEQTNNIAGALAEKAEKESLLPSFGRIQKWIQVEISSQSTANPWISRSKSWAVTQRKSRR